jgi:hypothetical protein
MTGYPWDLGENSAVFEGLKSKTGTGRGKRKDDYDWQAKNRELVMLINARKLEGALTLGQEMVEYVDRAFKKDSPEKATTYNNMGMVFLLTRDYAMAEESFRAALEMRKRIFGENHNEIVVVLLNMVQLYKMQAQEIMMVNTVEAT